MSDVHADGGDSILASDAGETPAGAPVRRSARSAPADWSKSFDESVYLQENPDVATAIDQGMFRSGYAHYLKYGVQEGRRPGVPKNEARQTVIRLTAAVTEAASAVDVVCNLEAVGISPSGGIAVLGWVDDASDPIDSVRIFGAHWRLTFDGARLGRSRRADVEAALDRTAQHPYGFYGFMFAEGALPVSEDCRVELRLTSGRTKAFKCRPRLMDDTDLRDLVLGHVVTVQHFGDPIVQAISGLDRAAGQELIRFNNHITARITAAPYIERFGRSGASYDASLIFCLYGKAEFLFLQAALLSGVEAMDRYELVFVSNSPELADEILREARASSRLYGLDITVVILSGNAGFGAANNVAVKAARSPRIVIVNPDVFPMTKDWGRRHLEIVETEPRNRRRLFGASLYYDDGSLMHGGMYFDLDASLSIENGRQRLCQLLRVEHYGKGTPANLDVFNRVRPVPAVSGAFMSWDRSWFESLGGFTQDYVFGHYEDADLCLRSLEAGVAPWMQALKMWHLEGKGSSRLPVHEGGSILNRWLFTGTWGETIADGLLGPAPERDLTPRRRAAAAE
ncbi:MAG TPA: glycosyltransferase [Caulobacteraceae bacterium]|nr:glycosyltransferase [Caulobacteraceae bacterium]